MHTAESHAPEKSRKYLGEDSAEALVHWLNFTEDAEGRARIIAVLNAFVEAVPLSVRSASTSRAGREGIVPEDQTLERLHLMKTQKRLDSLLGYYVVIPRISMASNWSGSRETLYTVGWRSAPGSKARVEGKSASLRHLNKNTSKSNERQPGQMGELEALLNALELIKSGLIAKIVSCKFGSCHKIYFQKFSHQRFCSLNCRVAASRDSDEARAKRAAYARQLYHHHKTKFVK